MKLTPRNWLATSGFLGVRLLCLRRSAKRDAAWWPWPSPHRIARGLFAMGLLVAAPAIATNVGGTISTNTLWNLAGSPYVVTSNLTVATTTTLTIEPGVTVKVGSSLRILIYGTLTAVGTASEPIVFTSNQATPTPGYWRSIQFYAGSSASQLSYVTISHGGQNNSTSVYSNLYVQDSSPTFDHVTVSNSGQQGVRVAGPSASPTITNSAVRASATMGIVVLSTAALSITDSELIDNASYAIVVWANSRLLGLTGLTIAGNGGGAMNGVGHYGGTVTGAEIWRAGIEWYLVEDLQVGSPTDSTPSLTVEPGVTVKMDRYQRLIVYGTLTAIGTPSDPITFASNQANPTPGYWRSLLFGVGSSASRLSYVTVMHGGQNISYSGYGAIYVDGASPTFDHLTITDSATYAVRAGNSPGLSVTNSIFARNAWGGLGNFTPLVPFIGRLNFWDAASGPSGEGAGDGQLVTTGVAFEPWLVDLPAQPQFIVQASPQNRVFNPTVGILNRLAFSTALSGPWALTYRDASGHQVRSFVGNGNSGDLTWDGRDEAEYLLANAEYSYELTSTSEQGESATVARGVAILDTQGQLVISGVAISQPAFSPNGDGIKETASLSGSFNFEDVAWQVTVRSASGTALRAAAGIGSAFAFAWDGRSDSSVLQPDGTYFLEVLASKGESRASAAGSTVLDTTLPAAEISTPSAATTVSNVLQNGSTDIAVVGTAFDQNLLEWNLYWGVGPSPSTWYYLRNSAKTAVLNGQLGVWSTKNIANGTQSLRLIVQDRAGNISDLRVAPTIGNFEMEMSVAQLNVSSGETLSYVSTVPFALSQSIEIRSEAGETVRTLLPPTLRSAGQYTDVWDGLRDDGTPLPDGPYFYFATAAVGESSMTWDLSLQYWDNWNGNSHPVLPAFDPFNNRPMKITYDFPYPGRVTALVSTVESGHAPMQCTAPNYCLVLSKYQESGPQVIEWAGVDAEGRYLQGIQRYAVLSGRWWFAKNAAVVFGTKPVISDLKVIPPLSSPAVGTQQVEFDLATYEGQSVSLELTFQNHESLSTLRKAAMQDVSPGAVQFEWDGRADNGMLVAPGRYTVTATVTDAIGNRVSSQILTTIRY